MTYKELMRELPDEITPEDAQKEYQAYLTEWWGSEVRHLMVCSWHLSTVPVHEQLKPRRLAFVASTRACPCSE
jgi:hypothetical protein